MDLKECNRKWVLRRNRKTVEAGTTFHGLYSCFSVRRKFPAFDIWSKWHLLYSDTSLSRSETLCVFKTTGSSTCAVYTGGFYNVLLGEREVRKPPYLKERSQKLQGMVFMFYLVFETVSVSCRSGLGMWDQVPVEMSAGTCWQDSLSSIVWGTYSIHACKNTLFSWI